MERLTEKITNKETGEVLAYRLKSNGDRIKADKKLGQYEDAEEHGSVYVLPCGLGDIIYSIHEKDIVEYTIFTIKLSPKMTIIECTSGMLFNIADFGKYLFLSREEAKKALAKMQEKRKRGHVWTEEQQIAWLEFFLRGGKTGRVIYFNNPSWHRNVPEGAYNDYVCVDGLQRVTAIQKFVNNEIKVFGSYYNEFTDNLRLNQTIKVNVNDLKTEKEVLQWYIDMNAGGTPHTNEEIERVKKLISELK